MRNGYWKCEFEGKNGKTIEKTIYAKHHMGLLNTRLKWALE